MSSVVPKCGWRATVKPGCICYGSPQLVSQNLVRAAKSDRTPPCCLHSGFFFLSQKIQKRDPPPRSQAGVPGMVLNFSWEMPLGGPILVPVPPPCPPGARAGLPWGLKKNLLALPSSLQAILPLRLLASRTCMPRDGMSLVSVPIPSNVLTHWFVFLSFH